VLGSLGGRITNCVSVDLSDTMLGPPCSILSPGGYLTIEQSQSVHILPCGELDWLSLHESPNTTNRWSNVLATWNGSNAKGSISEKLRDVKIHTVVRIMQTVTANSA
jgi:hypothetical protein